MATLELCISTLGDDGIRRVAAMKLPRVEGVSYLVSWQTENPFSPLPAELERPDVKVVAMSGRGLSRNRNNALDHSTADLVMNSDDDCDFTAEALTQMMSTMAAHPELDFALFPYTGCDSKVYPDTVTDVNRMPKGYHASSIELVMRRRVIDDGNRYHTLFGLGAELGAGEDEIFLLTLRRRGYRGLFFPSPVARHMGPSTGYKKITNPRVAEAMGAVIGFSYPVTAPLRVPLKAWRMNKSGQMPLFAALKSLTKGYFRQFFIKRPWKD